jgi:hypothetical protein
MRVANQTTGDEILGESRNMSNKKNMKSGTTKSASTSNWEGRTISGKNKKQVDRWGERSSKRKNHESDENMLQYQESKRMYLNEKNVVS